MPPPPPPGMMPTRSSPPNHRRSSSSTSPTRGSTPATRTGTPRTGTPPTSLLRTYTPPPNDVATYRDLLLFEERLKSNAENLRKRKFKYQLFLLQLVLLIAFLLAEVLLPPNVSLLSVPYRAALRRVLPEVYGPNSKVGEVYVHPGVAMGMLFVALTTLGLFFVSGLYEERVGWANRYVPHANRALRSFNMYFNVRKPPLIERSRIGWNPVRWFFARPKEVPAASMTSPQHDASSLSQQNTSSQDPVTRAPVAPPPPQPRSIPIPAIPPSSNPRGELIFSSRVDRTFREGYERHRAAFERRREEREMKAREARGWGVSRWFQQGVWRRGKGKEAQAQASAGVEVEKGEKEKGTVDAKETEHEKGIIMKQRERRRSRERARESRVR